MPPTHSPPILLWVAKPAQHICSLQGFIGPRHFCSSRLPSQGSVLSDVGATDLNWNLWCAARGLQSVWGELSSAFPQLFGNKCNWWPWCSASTDLVDKIRDNCPPHFSSSQSTTWVMSDPIVIEQINSREKETFFIIETSFQAPSTCPPCLLGELAPRMSVRADTCRQRCDFLWGGRVR